MPRKSIKYNRKVLIGGKILRVDVLTSDQDKLLGYQAVAVAPISNKQGLVFVFDESEVRSFHMRNVLFDLDLLCFDEEGYLVNIVYGMKSPYNLESDPVTASKKLLRKVYSTKVPCKYCIEVLSGWNGSTIVGTSKLTFI